MKRHQSGVALLEALLASVILAIGLLGAVALQAKSYSALSDATMRAEATIASEKLLGLMTNDLANLDSYSLAANGTPDPLLQDWYDETRGVIPDAVITVTVTPTAGANRSAVTIVISWISHLNGKTSTSNGQTYSHSVTAYLSQAS
jgi:type IV pilus assembly protein PilV